MSDDGDVTGGRMPRDRSSVRPAGRRSTRRSGTPLVTRTDGAGRFHVHALCDPACKHAWAEG